MNTPRAFVVGSGPNGLVAAIRLARAGYRVRVIEAADRPGGAARSSHFHGTIVDDCAAVHPLAVVSPAFQRLGVTEKLPLSHPDIPLVHLVLPDHAVALHQSVDATAAGLATGSHAWRRLFSPLVARQSEMVSAALSAPAHVLGHGVHTAMHLGLRSMLPASTTAGLLGGGDAAALFAGIAAHTMAPLTGLLSSGAGVVLGLCGQTTGWPVVVGGTGVIAGILVDLLHQAGGEIVCGTTVTGLDALGICPGEPVVLSTTPRAAAAIVAASHNTFPRQPRRIARRYRRFVHGPAAWRVDFLLAGPIGWLAEQARSAGTVHIGGTARDVIDKEQAVNDSVVPDEPFVLVGQQYLADESRLAVHRGQTVYPVWVYAHVPAGCTGDETARIIATIDRHAPGFGGQIVDMRVRGPKALEEHNPNLYGGDIGGGAATPLQLLRRPRLVQPWDTGVPGVVLASASTSPGGGVHGMAGWQAAGYLLSGGRTTVG
ncbi:phytoene desaturase family protein [Corynebacterium mendelii]|uniref:NAD(P)/FAD-dependent oxidoreductase n=1 Tax=Corynebacterium mendelii TaxID=2765362 RepID=A0A939E385_9CORY|nr:NAD(P)/FAD-dependent oxidoreductase [Corynebacterium mendelii]